MKKSLLQLFPSLIMIVFFLSSCAKEPTLGPIEAEVDGFSVSFSAFSTDAPNYLWEFGDETTSTELSPIHVYEHAGNYTVSLTVSGRGGEAQTQKEVRILPSVNDMLTGGSNTPNGKTWVLSSAYVEGVNGGSVVDNDMVVILPTVEDILSIIGLGEEYDNEFTFYSDGRYKVDVKNGKALTAGIYATLNDIIIDVGNEENTMGIYQASYSNPAMATWTLHTEDLVIDAISNPFGQTVPAPVESRTITGKKWVSISGDAFFGILDFPSTRQFLIKEISPERMDVALFICIYYYDENKLDAPAYLYHLSYVPQ